MIRRRVRLGGPLDRYVFVEFIKILATTALGFPLLLVIIDLTDNIDCVPAGVNESRTCAMNSPGDIGGCFERRSAASFIRFA